MRKITEDTSEGRNHHRRRFFSDFGCETVKQQINCLK